MSIAVLLSGGVDSSVVVHLLHQQGHRPSLFYIRIGKSDDADFPDCTMEEDIEMCQAVARRYGLSLEVVDLHHEYWEQVAAYATRRDSQGICFLGKVSYNDFVRRYLGERPGPIVEWETGRIIGRHRGYWFHTIGQRKGLGLSGGPWFVVGKNIGEDVIYVSHGYDTLMQYGYDLWKPHFHFITANPWPAGAEVEVSFKVRHTPEFLPALLTPDASAGGYRLHSSEPIQGIAPGQFCVIYDREASICIGSGEIALPL